MFSTLVSTHFARTVLAAASDRLVRIYKIQFADDGDQFDVFCIQCCCSWWFFVVVVFFHDLRERKYILNLMQ